VTIPVGSYATVYIPVSGNATVTESGVPVNNVQGIENLGVKDGCMVLKVMQGSYRFSTDLI